MELPNLRTNALLPRLPMGRGEGERRQEGQGTVGWPRQGKEDLAAIWDSRPVSIGGANAVGVTTRHLCLFILANLSSNISLGLWLFTVVCVCFRKSSDYPPYNVFIGPTQVGDQKTRAEYLSWVGKLDAAGRGSTSIAIHLRGQGTWALMHCFVGN